MISNTRLQRDVLDELEYEPSVRANDIGVAVHDGVVTLTGKVDSFVEREGAERAAMRVAGVKGVANQLSVVLPGFAVRDDTDIARSAAEALDANYDIPPDSVRVAVRNGALTMEGEVEWQFQRDTAYRVLSHLKGVQWVSNLVKIKPRVIPSQVSRKIESALQRSASLDARHILVEAEGSKVVLRGAVRSWAECADAERAAWSAPGVTSVESHLAVEARQLVAPL